MTFCQTPSLFMRLFKARHNGDKAFFKWHLYFDTPVPCDLILFMLSSNFYQSTLAKYFYNVKNGSSIITSKSSSKNLSNENKHWCFCCLQDKMWIKMPIVWKHRVYLFSLLRFFDLIIDSPFFDVVKRVHFWLSRSYKVSFRGSGTL